MKLLSVVFSLCLCASVARAQAIPSGRMATNVRLLASSEIGTESGLGYHLPHLLFGIDTEMPLGTHWEVDSGLSWSPDRKYATGDGNSLLANATGIYWPIQRVGLTGGAKYSHLWTSQFQKHALAPTAGAVLRDNWFGAPGRLYAAYYFPTGCQWATPANPCTIQSNRTSGVEIYQEFRLWPHWRIGIRGAWWHFADQSNQNDPAAGRIWHNTGTMSMVVRYEFRAGSLDTRY